MSRARKFAGAKVLLSAFLENIEHEKKGIVAINFIQ
jgi:hypothetical protein